VERDALKSHRAARTGTCHRCGWTGTTLKVRASERRAISFPGIGLRLCEECLTDLHRNTDVLVGHRHARNVHLYPAHKRHVA